MPFKHVVVAAALFSLSMSQTCIQSPPELELTQEDDQDGIEVYSGTLIYDAKTFLADDYGYPTSFTTRVHNGILPSPTLRFPKRDTIYKITVINRLGDNDPDDPGEMNQFHFPNTTNIHTHGLHISPESPSDDIFKTIHPGETYQYEYYIPCNHHGGTNWYHPHYHGMCPSHSPYFYKGLLLVHSAFFLIFFYV